MSATMNDLHAVGLNPFAVQLLAESMLKSAYVKHCGTQPLTFNYPVQREDCAGWIGVRITIEAVSVDGQPQAEAVPQAAEFCWLVEHFDIANKSTGHYYTGKVGIGDRVLTTMDPHQAQRYDTWRDANNASAKLGSTLTGTWRAMQHGFHRMEPQQAEPLQQLRAMIADDAFACTFQTMGQYRTALLRAADEAREHKGTAT